jgi:hypothetical protein
MKKALIAICTGLLLALTAVGAHAEIGVSIQLHQDQIASDAKTGMLTASEANAAMEDLNRIKFEYKRAKSDGHINNYERQMLNRMLLENATMIRRFQLNKLKR